MSALACAGLSQAATAGTCCHRQDHQESGMAHANCPGDAKLSHTESIACISSSDGDLKKKVCIAWQGPGVRKDSGKASLLHRARPKVIDPLLNSAIFHWQQGKTWSWPRSQPQSLTYRFIEQRPHLDCVDCLQFDSKVRGWQIIASPRPASCEI